jgi:hypothetical protein
MVYLVSQRRCSDLFIQERLGNTNANVNVNVNVTLLKITLLDDETIYHVPLQNSGFGVRVRVCFCVAQPLYYSSSSRVLVICLSLCPSLLDPE